jgi:hypothetical protein
MADEKTDPDDPAQSQRFIDMAHELEAIDDLSDRFEKLFKSVTSSNPLPDETKAQDKGSCEKPR